MVLRVLFAVVLLRCVRCFLVAVSLFCVDVFVLRLLVARLRPLLCRRFSLVFCLLSVCACCVAALFVLRGVVLLC